MPFDTEPTADDKLTKWRTHAYKIWAVIGALILCAGVLYVCGIIHLAVSTVIIAALVVFLLHGIVNKFESIGIPRVIGTLLAFAIVIVVLGGAVALLVPAMVTQMSSLAAAVPSYVQQLQDFAAQGMGTTNSLRNGALGTYVNQALDTLQNNIIGYLTTWATAAAGGVIGGALGLGNGLLVLFIALLVAFWVLIDLPKMSHELRLLFREDQQHKIDVVTNSFGTAIYGWAKATIVCAVVNGLACGIAFAVCGVPYSSVLGTVNGIMYVIPYIGPAIAYVLTGLLALTVSPLECIIGVIISVVVHELVANLVSPRLMKSSVNVHPAIILVVILVGEALGGIFGMLAAIPVAAALQAIFVTFFEANTGKELYSPDGALFQKVKETPTVNDLKKVGDTLTNLHLPKK